MPVRAIFLVGFMACGKTTTGKHLARRLGWDFIDLDAEVERREGLSVAEIFRDRGEYGEKGYRAAETSALRSLINSLERDTVIALGGGTFHIQQNRDLIGVWPSIFLDAPVDELWKRSQQEATKRPLRKDDPERFKALLQERLPHYTKATVTIVTSGRDPSSLCDEIESILQVRGSARPSAPAYISPTHSGIGEAE